jgi:hypothetical protein
MAGGWNCRGMRGINDNLEISNDTDPVDVNVYVQDALDRYALIPDDSHVDVTAEGRIPFLTGLCTHWPHLPEFHCGGPAVRSRLLLVRCPDGLTQVTEIVSPG